MGEQPIPSAGGDQGAEPSKTQREKKGKSRAKAEIKVEHEDMIGDMFWEARPWLLPEH